MARNAIPRKQLLSIKSREFLHELVDEANLNLDEMKIEFVEDRFRIFQRVRIMKFKLVPKQNHAEPRKKKHPLLRSLFHINFYEENRGNPSEATSYLRYTDVKEPEDRSSVSHHFMITSVCANSYADRWFRLNKPHRAPGGLRALMAMIENSVMPDLCSDGDHPSWRPRPEATRLVGGTCDCEDDAKTFMHSTEVFRGACEPTQVRDRREAQLSSLKDYLSTHRFICLRGALHQVVLSYASPVRGSFDDAPQMIVEDSAGAEMVRWLVDGGCDPNDEDDSGISPLQLAVSHCNYDVVKALLEAGADVKNITFDGGLFKRRSEYNLLVVMSLVDILAILRHYGFRLNDFHYYQIMRFLVDPEYRPLHYAMPIEALIHLTDKKVQTYLEIIIDYDCPTKCVYAAAEKIQLILRLVQEHNWYLDEKRINLLEDYLSTMKIILGIDLDHDKIKSEAERLEENLQEMKMSDGSKYSDFVKNNCEKAAELFLERDWPEMSEFFEETELFEEREESSKTAIRLIKAYIFRSLRKRYLKMGVDLFWRINLDLRHIIQAIPQVRDKIEQYLDDNDFLAMYKSTLPKNNPNSEIEMFEIPQIFMGKTYDVTYKYCWYKTYPKVP